MLQKPSQGQITAKVLPSPISKPFANVPYACSRFDSPFGGGTDFEDFFEASPRARSPAIETRMQNPYPCLAEEPRTAAP